MWEISALPLNFVKDLKLLKKKNSLKKRLHTGWLYLYDMSRKGSYRDGKQITGCLRLGVGVEVDCKEACGKFGVSWESYPPRMWL